MAKEGTIQARIMIALSEMGCLIFRNNTGALRGPSGVMVHYGLCVGSSDIIGLAPDGRFLAVEVKAEKGRASEAQLRFIEAINKKGGIAGIARSPQEAVELVRSRLAD